MFARKRHFAIPPNGKYRARGTEGFMKAARAVAIEITVAAVHEESFGEKIVIADTEARATVVK